MSISAATTYPVLRDAETVSDFWSAAAKCRGAKEVEIGSDDPDDRLACITRDCTEWALLDSEAALVLPEGVPALRREIAHLLNRARSRAQLEARQYRRRARIAVALTREGDHLLSWMVPV